MIDVNIAMQLTLTVVCKENDKAKF